jgi:hypothetical protein
MIEHENVPDTIFSNSPLRKVVHFDETISIPPQSTTSVSLLTSPSTTSLSFPLMGEKAGVRFKLCILFLSLFIALLIGFMLSLLLLTQFIHTPKYTSLSNQFSSEKNAIENNYRLFQHFNLLWINELDFSIDVCEDFYTFVCRKWLTNHPLSPLEFKRSWLTERSKDIRNKFAEKLAELSEIQAYNQQNQTEEVTTEPEFDDIGGLTPTKNE